MRCFGARSWPRLLGQCGPTPRDARLLVTGRLTGVDCSGDRACATLLPDRYHESETRLAPRSYILEAPVDGA